MKVRLVVLGCALTFALVSCGVRGPLERPGPMFGSAKAEYEAQQRAAAAAQSVVPLPPPPASTIRSSPMAAPIPPSASDLPAPSATPN
jgi:hypothetical protein